MNIESIHIKNVFKHKDTFITFTKGVNYLTGPNESGKTVILEMISYALFGTSVLRSEASDYKNLEVYLVLTINKIKYLIERNKKTNLYKIIDDAKELVVTGISPVNKYIIETLGYDSSVYFKTNYSTQLDGHSHAVAKKSERLALINKVNGIEEATKLEKYLESKKRALKSEIKGLDFSNSFNNISWIPNPLFENKDETHLKQLEQNIEHFQKEISLLEQQLSALKMIPSFTEAEQVELDHLNSLTFTDNEFNLEDYCLYLSTQYTDYKDKQSQLNMYKKYIQEHSVYIDNQLITEEYVSDLEHKLQENNLYNTKKDLLKEGDITCPHCQSNFPILYNQLDSIKGGDTFYQIPSILIIKSYRRFVDVHLETVKKYLLKIEDLKDITFDLEHFNTINTLCLKLKHLKELKDQYNKFYKTYTEKYDDRKEPLLNNYITTYFAKLQSYKDSYNNLNTYLKEKEVFQSTISLKNEIQTKISFYNEKIEVYDKLIEKSKSTRLAIQNNCIPSLNKKASHFIDKMTGSQHFSLSVSDTFELLLDNNLLSKYSGSTQVISSVAFRIALMDLFYKKTFPVFIGDEVDSFTDEDRAGFVRNAFETIAQEGYQLILISHFKTEDLTGNIININECKKG